MSLFEKNKDRGSSLIDVIFSITIVAFLFGAIYLVYFFALWRHRKYSGAQ